jgi:hypothetical protein
MADGEHTGAVRGTGFAWRDRPQLAGYERLAVRALVHAASRGDVASVDRLLNNGLSPNSQDEEGKTPLIAAARSGRSDVVDLLLTAHADPRVSDASGMSALDWARSEKQTSAEASMLCPHPLSATRSGFASASGGLSTVQQLGPSASRDDFRARQKDRPCCDDPDFHCSVQ